MTSETGNSGIHIGGSVTGQILNGDNSSQNATRIAAEDHTGSIVQFTELMLALIPELHLPADHETGARAALDVMRQEAAEEASPTRLQSAMTALVTYLSQAGLPALTAAFMTLAMHLGAAGPR
ncbi:hypothetical protein [Streptomyces sp. NPDC088794]|uniref:hypothetical protein n=1 Tax=Streptomyces sp. NPDC088794 TaxID=3365902 RepID=UPI0037F1BB91